MAVLATTPLVPYTIVRLSGGAARGGATRAPDGAAATLAVADAVHAARAHAGGGEDSSGAAAAAALQAGGEAMVVTSLADWPDAKGFSSSGVGLSGGGAFTVLEPVVEVTSLAPTASAGALMDEFHSRRGNVM